MKKKVYLFAKIIVYIVPILALGFLLDKNIVFSGRLMIEYQVAEKNPFASPLEPNGRVSEALTDSDGSKYRSIKIDPVYFNLKTPRSFKQATIKVWYRNSDMPEVKLGGLVDYVTESYDLYPVQNMFLENLIESRPDWSLIEEEGVVFLQRSRQYDSLREFLENEPPRDEIALYGYEMNRQYLMPGYRPDESNMLEINKSLRGTHEMYTYIKDEPLYFIFKLQCVNRHEGEDFVQINVYRGNKLIYTEEYKVDDVDIAQGPQTHPVNKYLALDGLEEGAYKVQIRTKDDDIFIRQIKTRQQYLVFKNRVYLGDNVGYLDENIVYKHAPTPLYTNASKLYVLTSHDIGEQFIQVNRAPFAIKERHHRYSVPVGSRGNGLSTILVSQNDIVIEGEGLFAFYEDQYFNPEMRALTDGLDIDKEGVNYIVATYQRPQDDMGWKVSEVKLDMEKLSLFKNKDKSYRLIISIPDLDGNDPDKQVDIKKLEILLEKEPITIVGFFQKLYGYIKRTI